MEANKIAAVLSILANLVFLVTWFVRRPGKCTACETRLAVRNGYCQACGQPPVHGKRNIGALSPPSTRNAVLGALLVYVSVVVATVVAIAAGVLPSGLKASIGLVVVIGGLVVGFLYAGRRSKCVVCDAQVHGKHCSQCGALTGIGSY